ncbi:hypothetical protein ASF74_14835 [Arthrobacter sp. Leaf145]|nr:hypothetical protein ASF74_14835 [Arthrobacter sp. Leaf145]
MTDLRALLAPIRERLGAKICTAHSECLRADAARLLAAIEAVESTAKYLDKLADGDRHYANLFRQAVAAALGSDTTNQEGTQ